MNYENNQNESDQNMQQNEMHHNDENRGSWQNEGRQNENRQGDERGSWQNENRQNDDRGGWQNESWGRAPGQDNQNYYERYRSSRQDQNYGYRQNDQYGQQYGNNSRNGSWNGYEQPVQEQKTPGKRRKGLRIAVAVSLAVIFVAFCVGVSWLAVDSIKTSLSAAVEEVTKPAEVLPEAESAEQVQPAPAEKIKEAEEIQKSVQVTAVVTDVTDVVDKVMPSCVSITNMSKQEIQSFWGQTYFQDSESNGSGIIIGQNETELLVVTNNHVVEEADTLYVQFIDGQSAQALVKGTDASVDLAVLAVSLAEIAEETKEQICIAQMGDSDSLKIGEPAIAIGNALGYGQSVTTGVISALNRTLEVSETGASNALIQTDAAINPGNSGGALLNINGEVIGINSSKIGDSLVEGMGYAIPISSAKPIIENLMNRETRVKVGEEERGYLGISCINVTAEISATYDMPEGIFVAQVYEGTGADRAGLVRGDIITEFDGNAVSSQAEMTALMQYYKAGDTVEITIMQGSASGYQAKKVELTLSSLEEMNAASEAQQEPQQPSGRSGYYRFP
ncbi:MAG: trypsin-like peptidase domain-containing protein [Lachnospiraceae bacterium]|nr:trypsin-like peptidase domain-containing protein [Lachnospiraceae bacterium]